MNHKYWNYYHKYFKVFYYLNKNFFDKELEELFEHEKPA